MDQARTRGRVTRETGRDLPRWPETNGNGKSKNEKLKVKVKKKVEERATMKSCVHVSSSSPRARVCRLHAHLATGTPEAQAIAPSATSSPSAATAAVVVAAASSSASSSSTPTTPTTPAASTPAAAPASGLEPPLGFDPDDVRRRYTKERDIRLERRPEGNAQYKRLDDLAKEVGWNLLLARIVLPHPATSRAHSS